MLLSSPDFAVLALSLVVAAGYVNVKRNKGSLQAGGVDVRRNKGLLQAKDGDVRRDKGTLGAREGDVRRAKVPCKLGTET
jgi:hypothetical protein